MSSLKMAVKPEFVEVQINISWKNCTFLVIWLHLTGVQSEILLKGMYVKNKSASLCLIALET